VLGVETTTDISVSQLHDSAPEGPLVKMYLAFQATSAGTEKVFSVASRFFPSSTLTWIPNYQE
jgi:hypothetical protein